MAHLFAITNIDYTTLILAWILH